MGSSWAMGDEFPVDELEEAHGLLRRPEDASESLQLEQGEVVHELGIAETLLSSIASANHRILASPRTSSRQVKYVQRMPPFLLRATSVHA